MAFVHWIGLFASLGVFALFPALETVLKLLKAPTHRCGVNGVFTLLGSEPRGRLAGCCGQGGRSFTGNYRTEKPLLQCLNLSLHRSGLGEGLSLPHPAGEGTKLPSA